jgi:hypothetical protein
VLRESIRRTVALEPATDSSRVLNMSKIAPVRFAIFLLLATTASAQLQTLGDVSFSAPDGYKYEFTPGDDHATMRLVNGQTCCVLVIYRPMHSSGDAETDLKSIWPRLLGRSAGPGLPTPIYDLRTQVGYPGKQSGSPSADRLNYLWLYTLETGQDFIPVVVLTTGRDIFDSQQSVIKRFVEGVRQGPVKAQAAKTTINLADLAGEWRHGEGSVTDYVNRSTGAFVTSSTVFFGETFVIAADGRYAYRFAGRSNNKTIREQSTGVLEMGGEFLVFRDNPGPQVRRYRFISYQPAIGGSTVLTVLPGQYPVTSPNIGLYGEKWVRAESGK